MKLAAAIAWGQGTFYLLTGLWALIHMNSFEAVTGPKTDDWLVKTVGALVAVIGMVLLVAARRRAFTVELALLAGGSALALAAIDVIYVAANVIRPIYLLDAVAEVGIAVVWGVAFAREQR